MTKQIILNIYIKYIFKNTTRVCLRVLINIQHSSLTNTQQQSLKKYEIKIKLST